MSDVVCEIWPMTGTEPYLRLRNPTVIPRVGELVEFTDRMGRVETVVWHPTDMHARRGSMTDIRVVVRCVPA